MGARFQPTASAYLVQQLNRTLIVYTQQWLCVISRVCNLYCLDKEPYDTAKERGKLQTNCGKAWLDMLFDSNDYSLSHFSVAVVAHLSLLLCLSVYFCRWQHWANNVTCRAMGQFVSVTPFHSFFCIRTSIKNKIEIRKILFSRIKQRLSVFGNYKKTFILT